MRALKTIILLFISNTFMTFAWYGHLKFKEYSWGKNLGLVAIILISWGLAFFEYVFQVPANRAGSQETGGPFSLVQLKTKQEAETKTKKNKNTQHNNKTKKQTKNQKKNHNQNKQTDKEKNKKKRVDPD